MDKQSADDGEGLVHQLAQQQYKNLWKNGVMSITLEELRSAGHAGVAKARSRYDPTQGTRFTTFAYPYIYGAIIDYLRSLDPLPQKQREKLQRLGAVNDQLRGTLGREPTIEEVADALKITVDEVRQTEALRETVLPLPTPGDGSMGRSQPRGATSSDHWSNPERAAMRGELRRDLNACLAQALTEEERRLVMLRFVANLTLQEVGRMVGIPAAESVRRRVVRATRHLKRCLEAKGWEVTDIGALLP